MIRLHPWNHHFDLDESIIIYKVSFSHTKNQKNVYNNNKYHKMLDTRIHLSQFVDLHWILIVFILIAISNTSYIVKLLLKHLSNMYRTCIVIVIIIRIFWIQYEFIYSYHDSIVASAFISESFMISMLWTMSYIIFSIFFFFSSPFNQKGCTRICPIDMKLKIYNLLMNDSFQSTTFDNSIFDQCTRLPKITMPFRYPRKNGF